MRPLFVLIKCEMGRAYETAGEAVDRIPEVSESERDLLDLRPV